MHKVYALNDLFLHTIIYIRLIITITSFVIKGDGKFFAFFKFSHSLMGLKCFYATWWAAAGSWCFTH